MAVVLSMGIPSLDNPDSIREERIPRIIITTSAQLRLSLIRLSATGNWVLETKQKGCRVFMPKLYLAAWDASPGLGFYHTHRRSLGTYEAMDRRIEEDDEEIIRGLRIRRLTTLT